MAIFLNASNSVSKLAIQLAGNLQRQKGIGVLQPQWVVTQTEGMNGWLKFFLAEQLGIAANIHYCKPNDIISRLYVWAQPTEKMVLDTQTLQWYVYAILNDAVFQKKYPVIAAFYAGDDIKQITLAQQLADLYDQYQIYRHDTIDEWNTTAKQSFNHTPDWQQYIWQQLKIKLTDTYTDRVEIADTIIKSLNDAAFTQALQKRIPELHFFGIAVVTPYFLQLYKSLAQFINIHLYITNPAPEQYWMDDATEKQLIKLRNKPGAQVYAEKNKGNDLLLNWGQITKTAFALLLNDEALINQYDTQMAAPTDEHGWSLLKKIQTDIYNNAVDELRCPIEANDIFDNSLVMTGNYTPLREVEVLYNHLIDYLKQHNGQYSTRDILVLVTDIDKYAPYIHAVFGNAPYRLPYSVADESITTDNNLFSALQQILLLNEERFEAEAVLELLESPYIRKRFGIENPESIRTAVQQAGIIFGMNGQPETDTRIISWNYGLKKLLYGLCMSGEVPFNDGEDTVIPLDTAEGGAMYERVRLIYFVQVLQQVLQNRRHARTISAWAQYLNDVVSSMLFAADDEDEDYPRFVSLLEQLLLLEPLEALTISYDAFKHSFMQHLATQQKAQAFTGPGITFCSLVPMRSIPFKIIAMLGMNFDQFPRKNVQVSFSLMAKMPKLGDRNLKDNDKHLFLETIMSATEHLYISYIARNEKDGTSLPAASLIDELIDYVAKGLGMDGEVLAKKWIQIHPLHNFSSAYFVNSKWNNYLNETRFKTPIAIQTVNNQVPQFDFSDMEVDALCRFVSNPAKTYFNKRLNVYYYQEETLIAHHEPFELSPLHKPTMWQAIVKAASTGSSPDVRQLQLHQQLPLSNMGQAVFNHFIQEKSSLYYELQQVVQHQTATTIPIQITCADTTITGHIKGIFGNKMLYFCHSSDVYKHLAAFYVQYACSVAQGYALEGHFIWEKNQQIFAVAPRSLSTKAAYQYLEQLTAFYKTAHQQYVYFYPALASHDFKLLLADYDTFKAAIDKMLNNERDFTFNDVYLQKAIEDGFFDEVNYPALVKNTLTIMQPIQTLLPQLF